VSLANIRPAFEASGYKTRSTSEGFASQCSGDAHAHNAKSGLSLNVTEKNGHVLMHCKSHGCDRYEVIENIGLPVSELYPDGKFDRKQYVIKKSQQQIENECIHAWLILAQVPSMTIFSGEDKEFIRKARETVKKHNFSGSDYQRIEARKQAEVTRMDSAYISKAGKVFYDCHITDEREACSDALDESFDA